MSNPAANPDFNVDQRLTKIMREVFKQPELQLNRTLTAFDVKGWDSLSNIKMLLALEKEFGVKISAGEVIRLKNVGDLMDTLSKKLAARPQ